MFQRGLAQRNYKLSPSTQDLAGLNKHNFKKNAPEPAKSRSVTGKNQRMRPKVKFHSDQFIFSQ